ncbi:hypothetical protein ABW636_18785 [Aquimarina sp. 2201CG1-2-11]|uniref:hypothetical protein n=1 Tax=Aquimarina discodermiae TaxID=3231043 RepID=UPI0034621EA3
MKTTHLINKWSFIITLLLYTTIYGGLLAQIALGGIQIICGIVLLFQWKKLTNQSRMHISLYWTLVLLYGISWFLFQPSFNDFFFFVYYIIIPMSIAGYFIYVTYQIKKMKHEFQLSNI